MPDPIKMNGDTEVPPYIPDRSWIDRFLPGQPRNDDHEAFRTELSGILDSEGEILPALDSPLGRLWQMLNSEDSVIEDCVGIIELDPILTTRLYRAANSAVSRGNATTIYEAVMHVGHGHVRQLVCASGVMKKTEALKLPAGWDKFWFRSLFVARVTERMASSFFRTSGTEYLAGLVHDIGWLFTATFFPKQLDVILAGEGPIRNIELDALSFTHAELSAAICARSHLPGRVVNAVLYHHHPVLLEVRNFSTHESAMFLGVLLSVSDKLADAAGLGLNLGKQKSAGLDEIQEGPEARWLGTFGKKIDLKRVLEEETTRTTSTFSSLFG